MNRRVDHKTAELVDIALLTRAAFGSYLARRYVQMRGTKQDLMNAILARPVQRVRSKSTMTSSHCEGRRERRRE